MKFYTVKYQDGTKLSTKNIIVHIKIEDGVLKAYHSYNMEPEIIPLENLKSICIS